MKPANARSSRLRELDALRGIAALGIVFWHYSQHFQAWPLFDLLQPFYRAGYYSVDFFFVLSGLVLARAYLNEERRLHFTNNVVRRIARIYPLHLVTLLCVAAGQLYLTRGLHRPGFITQHQDWFHFLLNLSVLNYVGFQDGFSFNTPSWSISTEFYVNLLFFALLAAGGRLTWAFIALVVVSFFLLTGTGDGSLARPGTILHVQVSVVRTVFGFFVGVLLHQLAFRKREGAGTASPPWIFDLAFAAIAAVLVLAAAGHLGHARFSEMAVVVVAYPLLILSATGSSYARRILRLRPLTYLGDISYSVYLIHFPVQLAFHILQASPWLSLDYAQPLTLAAFLITTIVLSGLSYRFLERPMQHDLNAWWAARRGRDLRRRS